MDLTYGSAFLVAFAVEPITSIGKARIPAVSQIVWLVHAIFHDVGEGLGEA